MKSQTYTRRIRDLIDGEHSIYLFLATRDAMQHFQRQAKKEWINYGDGVHATKRKSRQIMRLLNDGTICFVGYTGIMRYYHSTEDNVLRIDYEKYIIGEDNYFIIPETLKLSANRS